MGNFRVAKYSSGGDNPAIDDPNKLSGDDNIVLTSAQAAAVAAGFRVLPRWSAALAAVRAGTRNARLLVIGDSTTVGAYSLSGTGYATNNMSACWPYQLASLLSAAGYQVNTDAVFGDQTGGNGLTLLAAHDTRQTFGANWSLGIQTSGGNNIINDVNNSVQPRTFTPARPFDTIELQYLANPVYGLARLSIDGGTTTLGAQIDQSTSTSMVKITRTVPLGNYTVDFRRVAGSGAATINATCIRTYNSAVKTVDILNAGAGGTTTLIESDDSQYYTPLTVNSGSGTYEPDLVVICLDINNWIAGYAAGTYDLSTTTTHGFQLQKMIDAFRATADVVVMTGAPSGVSVATTNAQRLILQSTRVIASANNVPLIDTAALWGSQVAGAAAGYYATGDVTHPGSAGYAAIASRVASMLIPAQA
jgi:lysophospholipase L1-like esterase